MWNACTRFAVAVGIRGFDPPVSHGKAVAAAQHAEIAIVGVVLHHQSDDMLDLGKGVGPFG
jgi:hypothetical protein